MFGDMAWADGHAGDGGNAPAEWEMELLRLRYDGDSGHAAAAASSSTRDEPMELSPDPFYLHPASSNALTASMMATTAAPTLTTSASCPSFTSLYDFDGDDLLRDIPDGEPLDSEPYLSGNANAAFHGGGMPLGLPVAGGYDEVLQFQQQHQPGSMRPFPHHAAGMANDHMTLLQQTRRPLHTSASFTSLSSMETEYRRRLATKRKKAVVERWNKAQRHKSFDSTTSSVATAPSPAASMEFSTFASTNTFQSTPEQHYLEDLPGARRPMESEMVGFSIDDFPTTFTSDASWPMPPPLSLANGSTLEGFGDAPPQFQAPQAAFAAPPPSEMDQLLLSDNEKANVSSLLDAIRDFDSPLPTHNEEKPAAPVKRRTSPTLSGRPRSASGQNQHRAGRSPHLRGIARMDSGKRKEMNASPLTAPATAQAPRDDINARTQTDAMSVRDRIQLILDQPTSSIVLSDDEKNYIAQAPQLSKDKAAETAGSLWLLLHASKCTEVGCSIAGCEVMRRVVRHCRSCEAPLGKCKDPCNDAKAMLLHYATCRQANKSSEAEDGESTCNICAKMQEIDKAHHALNARPPLSPQIKPKSPPHVSMAIPPFGMPALSGPGGPVLIAPQPAFSSPLLKPATSGGGGSKHVPIQPNPLPTASNPMGMIGTFPHFGVSLALYLEQTSAPFRAEVKSRVEKRVTNAAGQDLIQHMQKKTRLRSLEDLRSEARAVVLGEMERELHFHMQAVNWASIANSANGDSSNSGSQSTSSSPAAKGGDSSIPPYLLSVAAAGFAAFYAQQASLQAAFAGGASPFGVASSSRRPLSRQSSTGSLTTSASSSSLASLPLAPKRSMSSSSLTHQSPSMSPKESLPNSDKSKEAPLAV